MYVVMIVVTCVVTYVVMCVDVYIVMYVVMHVDTCVVMYVVISVCIGYCHVCHHVFCRVCRH